MGEFRKKLHRVSPMKIILTGYLFIILVGAGLLCLPISVKAGEDLTSFSDAVFTAASATCVTGLVRFDTYTHWSFFGQLVILGLIQVGGIGFMTFAIYVVSMTKKKIGMIWKEKLLLQPCQRKKHRPKSRRMKKQVLLKIIKNSVIPC